VHQIRFQPLGELTALPQTPSWFKGPTSKGRVRGGREERKKGRGREGEGPAPFRKLLDPPMLTVGVMAI